jgi:hypothetical protein
MIGTSASPGRMKRLHCRAQVRSIHFADDHSTLTSKCSKPLHTIYNVENWMNLVEKDELWVHSHETLRNVISIRALGTLYQQQLPIATSHHAYSEALQSTFLECSCDTQNGNEQYCRFDDYKKILAKSGMCEDLLSSNNKSLNYQLLGLHRGIEAYCVPMLAITRLSVRKNLIQTIVLMDHILRCHPNRDLLLGNIVRPLTIPSKRFAHVMGIVDELNACSTASFPADALVATMISANAVAV